MLAIFKLYNGDLGSTPSTFTGAIQGHRRYSTAVVEPPRTAGTAVAHKTTIHTFMTAAIRGCHTALWRERKTPVQHGARIGMLRPGGYRYIL